MWSREEALTDPSIREPLIFLSEFRFSLRDIPAEITIRLYRPIHSAKIVVRRSHDISVSGVLHAAVDQFLSIYNAARAKGLKPDASWLRPNPDFS